MQEIANLRPLVDSGQTVTSAPETWALMPGDSIKIRLITKQVY